MKISLSSKSLIFIILLIFFTDSFNWRGNDEFNISTDELNFINESDVKNTNNIDLNNSSKKSHNTENNDIIPNLSAQRRKNILKICGELCNLNRPIRTPEPNYGYFGETTANIDCKALFESTILDEPSNLRHPPKLQSISREFLNDYTMNGKVDIQEWWIEDMFLGKKAKVSVWSEELIDGYASKALKGDFKGWGNYMQRDRITLFHVLQNVTQVKNQSVLVIGSESPWIEAMLVASELLPVPASTETSNTTYSQDVKLNVNEFVEFINARCKLFPSVFNKLLEKRFFELICLLHRAESNADAILFIAALKYSMVLCVCTNATGYVEMICNIAIDLETMSPAEQAIYKNFILFLKTKNGKNIFAD